MNITQVFPMAHLFNWWSIGLWALAFVLMILLFTSAWRYVVKFSLVFAIIGWLCAAYAGLTGNWFIGWFAWTIFLSVALFMRGIMEHLERLHD
jgi:hypothetical protein